MERRERKGGATPPEELTENAEEKTVGAERHFLQSSMQRKQGLLLDCASLETAGGVVVAFSPASSREIVKWIFSPGTKMAHNHSSPKVPRPLVSAENESCLEAVGFSFQSP